jgi:hypothetical protein
MSHDLGHPPSFKINLYFNVMMTGRCKYKSQGTDVLRTKENTEKDGDHQYKGFAVLKYHLPNSQHE